jgi:plasmid stabilization system protein ParE
VKFALIIEANAREEMQAAGDWCESREVGVGGRFIRILDDYFARIVSDPFHYRKASPTVRKAKVFSWPYSIYFTILEEKGVIKIIAVWQGNQEPAKLRRRL